jgi:RNA polymerase sigma-70 factor (ECF subfamily)
MDALSTALRGPSPHSARAERDRELRADVAAIAAGDQQAMARLYDRTNRIVFALVVRLMPDRDVAEEVLLDVYMQVWQRAASFDSTRGEVATWLLTIARSRALDRRRSRDAQTRRSEEWDEHLGERLPDCACGCDPVEARTAQERCHSVREAIAQLPQAQRHMVELAFLAELSHSQIAERTGEPLGTVKTRIRLGMMKLRELLASWEELA